MIETSLYIAHQKALDERIFAAHNTTREATRQARILALIVECAEFANEMRSFKYWSRKAASPSAILLEEFADGLHFLVSLCIDLAITPSIAMIPSQLSDIDLTLEVLSSCVKCAQGCDETHLVAAFHAYASLAHRCNFTPTQLFQAYQQKHHKNHVRQDEHY